MEEMGKVLVLGGGPAGISAALYARRSGAEVRVVFKGYGTSALSRAELIQNYYGLAVPLSGAELERHGIEGAKAVGVEFVEDELIGLEFREDFRGFRGVSSARAYEADCLIIAAGASRKAPPLPGLTRLEGHGVSYCAICDGFFYRGKTVAVLGSGEYALHEAKALLPHASKVLLFSNGEKTEAELPKGVELHAKRLVAIEGEERITGAAFADGSRIPIDGLFVAIGTAGSTDLARRLGVMLDGENIKVDAHMCTNVPGVFAAGDCTGGLLQISKAVQEGAEAGLSAVKFLRSLEEGKI